MTTSVPKRFQLGPGAAGLVKNIYGDRLAVAGGSTQTIVSYTILPNKKFYVALIEFNGGNIGYYEIYVNSVLQAYKYTSYAGPYYGDFFLNNLPLVAGDVVELRATNIQSYPADYHGRILGVEEDV